MSASANRSRSHGRSGVLLAALAALAMLATLSNCADDSPAVDTPGQGSQVDTPGQGSQVDVGTDVDDITGGDGNGTVLPRSTSPGATDAPNPNAGGGGAGTGTSPP